MCDCWQEGSGSTNHIAPLHGRAGVFCKFSRSLPHWVTWGCVTNQNKPSAVILKFRLKLKMKKTDFWTRNNRCVPLAFIGLKVLVGVLAYSSWQQMSESCHSPYKLQVNCVRVFIWDKGEWRERGNSTFPACYGSTRPHRETKTHTPLPCPVIMCACSRHAHIALLKRKKKKKEVKAMTKGSLSGLSGTMLCPTLDGPAQLTGHTNGLCRLTLWTRQ